MRYSVSYAGETYTRTSHKHYEFAVIPVYTLHCRYVPSEDPEDHGMTVARYEECPPYYGKPQFCGSYALACKAAKPGWIIVPVTCEDEQP